MELYRSPYLIINKKENVLIQEWSDKKLSPEIFKNEILQFLFYFDKYKPSTILWLQEHFNLEIKTGTFESAD